MEILGEFDNESPLYVSFCKRISPEDFEKQSLTYTQKSLQDLYTKMEQNPGICESIVRKRKQLENKDAGLASYLKAKFSSLFSSSNPMEMEDIQEEVEQLKREMQKASSYAFAAKRASQGPWERRGRKSIPVGKFGPSHTRLPEPATIPSMPKIFGPYPKQTERSTGSLNMDLKQPWGGMSPVNQKSCTVNLHPLTLNPSGCHPSSLGSNSVSRLKPSTFPRTTANSPAESLHSTSPSSPASVLNTLLPAQPRVKKEDKQDNENLGPGSHPTGA
ncbi:uncharacterized protein LOC133373324 [Rhineura floridana]|uniref:uncharacterized protein LOC133373324 n=1 Tax=Rhineura floridana TaxID=261503 RepID=UPI002AC83976|nr:uncharacterized protein LOC133373324 [Rhineura floridana]